MSWALCISDDLGAHRRNLKPRVDPQRGQFESAEYLLALWQRMELNGTHGNAWLLSIINASLNRPATIVLRK
jgi:hypothetical protein